MKFLSIGLAFATAFAAAAAPVNEGESRKLLERETELLSARLLSADGGRRWSAAPFPEAESLLFDRMKRDPAAAASCAAARKDAGEFFRAALAADYAATQRKLLEPFREQLTPEEAAALEKAPAGLLEKKFTRLFSAAFTAARNRLVAAQRTELLEKVYPSEAELEANDDARLTQLLSARLTARRRTPLLEENSAFVREKVVAPVIASGRSQQKRQLELVTKLPVAPELWTIPEIVPALEKQLAAETGKWREDKVYALFGKTRSAIAERAARVPLERVIAALPARVAVPDYAALLAREPEKHLEPEPEISALCAGARRQAVADTLRELAAPEPVASELLRDPAVEKAAAEAVDARVRPALLALRRQAVEAQLESRCPELVAGRWRGEPAVVEAFHAGGGEALPPLPEFAFPDEPLFSETRQAIAEQARKALQRGAAEVAGQFRLVALEYDGVVAEMRKRSGENRRGWLGRWFGSSEVTLEAIRELYCEKVLELHRKGNPLYPALFDSVRDEIDVRSRAILQQLEKEAQEPREALPEEPPSERVVSCRIEIDAGEELLQIQLNGRRFSAMPGPGSEQKLIDDVVAEFERFREATASAGPVRFEIELRIGAGPVYYRFVANLREALKSAGGPAGTAVRDDLSR